MRLHVLITYTLVTIDVRASVITCELGLGMPCHVMLEGKCQV